MSTKQQNECDTGTVVEINGDYAIIELDSNEACQACSIKSLCNINSSKNLQFKIYNSKKAKLKDIVKFEIDPTTKILSNFYVFILPLIIIIITYFLSKNLFHLSEDISIIISVLSLIISYFIVKKINYLFKKNQTMKIRMVKIIN